MRCVWVWFGEAVMVGYAGVRMGMFRYVSVRQVGFGMVGRCKVWQGGVWLGRCGTVGFGQVG